MARPIVGVSVKRTGYGEGRLRKRGTRRIDGVMKDAWEATAFVGRDAETGKQLFRYKTVYGTNAEARDALAEFLVEIKLPPEEAKKGYTFAEPCRTV